MRVSAMTAKDVARAGEDWEMCGGRVTVSSAGGLERAEPRTAVMDSTDSPPPSP